MRSRTCSNRIWSPLGGVKRFIESEGWICLRDWSGKGCLCRSKAKVIIGSKLKSRSREACFSNGLLYRTVVRRDYFVWVGRKQWVYRAQVVCLFFGLWPSYKYGKCFPCNWPSMECLKIIGRRRHSSNSVTHTKIFLIDRNGIWILHVTFVLSQREFYMTFTVPYLIQNTTPSPLVSYSVLL